MSGDVQPRKRKDKKKKRDDEASHGVHVTKMGSDDVLLHVHEEHGTGGHWCAKIIFFALMAILMGLVGLIILENRGLSDVDTPLSESRFSDYFDGWVDEHRGDHDDHHDSHGSLEHDDHDDHAVEDDEHDDEDDHDEPFEEEVDHSEGDDEVAEEEDDNVTPEEEDEDGDNTTAENVTAEEEEDEDVEEEEEEDDEDENVTAEVDDNVTAEEADDDNATGEDDNGTKEVTVDQDDGDDDEEDDEEDDDDGNKTIEDDNVTKETSKPASQGAPDDDDDPYDEDDDDGTFDSLEKIVDNDAAELDLLKEKARQQAAAESKQNVASAENDLEDEADSAPSWASSLTIKVGVGLALALVARLVLIRKNPISNEDAAPENIMKRRLTIVSTEENISEHGEDADEPLPEDDYSEEEIEIEEEIEYIEEEVEPIAEENQIDAGGNDYTPETFEQLNAMYRTKDNKEEIQQKSDTKPAQETGAHLYSSPYSTTFSNNNNRNNNTNIKSATYETPKSLETTSKSLNNSNSNNSGSQNQALFKVPSPPAPVQVTETKVNVQPKFSSPKESATKLETTVQQPVRKEVTYDMDYEKVAKEQKPKDETKKEITHDLDYQPEDDDIDYDEDDIYDDDAEAQDDDSEDLDDEDLLDDDDDDAEDLEEGDDEDASDIDDSELMNRLEAKYGKLPAKEYESDEDPDDPTWTQIKPKIGGGPQSLQDDNVDLFEQELRRANDEMMRERYDDALNSFDRLIEKYSGEPQVYLGKAQTLDYYAEKRQSNRLLLEAIAMYEKYLEFNVKDNQLQEYRSAAERCVERLRFLGNYQQSLPIHHLLIGKFPQESSIRNQLAVTLLMLNRLSDAKQILQEILQLWPQDGLALVHYGFVLKQLDQDYHNASIYLRQGIASNASGTQDGRFYFQLGESLQRLGKQAEAVEVFRKGAVLKLFPSVYQRSLYNEANLKAQPFWSLEETTYEKFLKKLQDNWLAIQAEGLNILSKAGGVYFLNEVENLKNKGDWKQFELYARGQQRQDNCLKAPITCSLIQQFPAARDCRRGQVKFSVMHAGTHIWPHCGPTNCRLRAHLGLVVPTGTRIRVAEQERSWQEGKFLIFDDSFEHEVWHEGQGLRLVLIVDMWHPELSEQQRRSLSAI